MGLSTVSLLAGLASLLYRNLAAQQIFRGTGYVLTDCATIGPMPKQFTAISENFIPGHIGHGCHLCPAFAFINLKLPQDAGK